MWDIVQLFITSTERPHHTELEQNNCEMSFCVKFLTIEASGYCYGCIGYVIKEDVDRRINHAEMQFSVQATDMKIEQSSPSYLRNQSRCTLSDKRYKIQIKKLSAKNPSTVIHLRSWCSLMQLLIQKLDVTIYHRPPALALIQSSARQEWCMCGFRSIAINYFDIVYCNFQFRRAFYASVCVRARCKFGSLEIAVWMREFYGKCILSSVSAKWMKFHA